jgi:hypothetical protein
MRAIHAATVTTLRSRGESPRALPQSFETPLCSVVRQCWRSSTNIIRRQNGGKCVVFLVVGHSILQRPLALGLPQRQNARRWTSLDKKACLKSSGASFTASVFATTSLMVIRPIPHLSHRIK